MKTKIIIVIIIVIVLGGFGVWSIRNQAPGVVVTADWKTYTSAKYSFMFKYPGKYFLATPLVSSSGGTLDFDDQTRQLNIELPKNSEFLHLNIVEFSKLSPERSCEPDGLCSYSQADINKEISEISKAKVGASVSSAIWAGDGAPVYGKVIMAAGVKALEDIYFDPTGGDWNIRFEIFDENKNAITVGFAVYTENEKATIETQKYKDLKEIISNFRFTK